MRKLAATMAALVLMTGAAAVVFWMQLKAERTRGAELSARVAALEAAVPSSAVAARPLVATSAQGAPPASVPAVAPPVAGPADSAMSLMAAEMVRTLYPDLNAELGLSKEEADKFMALLARQQGEIGMNSIAMFTGNGSPSAMQELQVRLVDQEQAHREEQKAMLGNRYARWEEYQGVAAARLEVEQLRTTLAATANPLSDVQGRALEVAFAAEETRNQADERSWLASDAARRSPNLMREQMQREMDSRKRFVDVARPHLSATQLDAYRKQVDLEISMASTMIDAMGAGEAR